MDLIALDELPISLWVDTMNFDMEDNDNDATLLAYGSPSSPSAATTTAPGKALASDLYFMYDTMTLNLDLDLDELTNWGFAKDNTSSAPTPIKEQLIEVDSSWAMVELSDAVVVEQKTLELHFESPKKTADWLSSPSLKTEPAAAPLKKMTKKELLASSPQATKSISPKTRQRKVKDDPIMRVHQRKSKQRGYERSYRGRLHDQRCQDELEWLHYEAELRQLLARRCARALRPQAEQDKASALVQLIHAERTLQEDRVYLRYIAKWLEALDIWGVETEESRNIRYEINALPQVRGLPKFTDFSW